MSSSIPPGHYQIQNVATKKSLTTAGAGVGNVVQLSQEGISVVRITNVPNGYSIQEVGTVLTIAPNPTNDAVVWGQASYPWRITVISEEIYIVEEPSSSRAWYDSPCESGCEPGNDYIALKDLQQNDRYYWYIRPVYA